MSELAEHPAAWIGRHRGEIALARGEAEAGGGDDGGRCHEYRSGATVMVSCHDKHGAAALSPFYDGGHAGSGGTLVLRRRACSSPGAFN